MRISDWSSDVCSSDLKQNRDERRHDIIIIAEMPAAEGSGIELLERRWRIFDHSLSISRFPHIAIRAMPRPGTRLFPWREHRGPVAQLARAPAFQAGCCVFESRQGHHCEEFVPATAIPSRVG